MAGFGCEGHDGELAVEVQRGSTGYNEVPINGRGDPPAVRHPTVELIDMGDHITRRQTGRTSMSRSDSAWT
ncbi:hypothetical protein GA0115240_135238 [Streptomyces sp. DvalAA-14]|nr:hypothetical protein GA0115240_135238 [Streptomyces sp. DvalAA-14]